MTQRDKMRELYRRYQGDKAAVIKAYVEAEQSGEVDRKRNASGYGIEQYAQALWNDGEKKGWLSQSRATPAAREVPPQPSYQSPSQEAQPKSERTQKVDGEPITDTKLWALRQFRHVPESVMLLYEEAVQGLNGAMYVSCAGVLRAMIENICDDKGIVEGVVGKDWLNRFTRSGNLEGKINGLVEAGLITQHHADVLHRIRQLGNDSLHRGVAFDKNLLETAVEIMESLIYGVYELPNKVGQFPSRAK